MSYNVSIHCGSCGEDLMYGNGNMTSNLAKMWTEAGAPLAEWDGKRGVEILPDLQRAIDTLTADVDYFRKYQPTNGWGDYEGCVKYLSRIRNALAREPYATMRVSH